MPWGWNTLPLEIRWRIRDMIRNVIYPWTTSDPPCPALPLVCREWQQYFAHENFRLLVLDQSRLAQFRNMVDSSRISFVATIVLGVKLTEYDCDVCEKHEDESTHNDNLLIFLGTLRSLTDVLSSFDASFHPGITLDIGAYSVSDGQHTFRECRFSDNYRYGAGQNIYKQHSQALAQARSQAAAGSNVCPGWRRVCNPSNSAPLEGSEQRIYATIGRHYNEHNRPGGAPCSLEDFKPVPIISELVLRRHYHRHISPNVLAEFIEEGLPKLQGFRHEVPLHASIDDAISFWRSYDVICKAFPATLGHLAVYQEFEQVPQLLHTPEQLEQLWDSHMILLESMIQVIARLRFFTAAFGAQAEQIFHHVSSGRVFFDHLECMVLTSNCLERGLPRNTLGLALGELIEGAGHIAYFHMPKLRFLTLWEGNSNRGYFLRFYYGMNRQPSVDCYIRGFPYQNGVDRAFRQLAGQLAGVYPPRFLQVYNLEMVGVAVPTGYPTDCPGVPEAILHPESLQQMRGEWEESGTNQHESVEMQSEWKESSCVLPSGR